MPAASGCDPCSARASEGGAVENRDTGKHMVTTSASQENAARLMGDADGPLTLRIRSPQYRGRVLRLTSPKCTIGSDPGCTLRLVAPGVHPIHCLILRGSAGTYVRRWSPDTCLNGAGFTESLLQPGDRLDIGPVEFEVLDAACHAQQPGPRAFPQACPEPPRLESPPASETCDTCRAAWRETEAALVRQLQQTEAERERLVEQCQTLRDELQRQEVSCREMVEQVESLRTEQQHEQREYRACIEELRTEMDQLTAHHHDQVAEQEKLIFEATVAAQRVTELEGEMAVTRQQAQTLERQLQQAQELVARQQEQLRCHAQPADNRVGSEPVRANGYAEADAFDSRVDQPVAEGPSESPPACHAGVDSVTKPENCETQLQREQEIRSQLEDAAASLDQARQRTAEQEHLLHEAVRELEQLKHTADDLERDRERLATEVAQWRDVAQGTREELRLERAEHQRVRAEWHVDRENFEFQLASRSEELQRVQAQRAQEMRDAESLIQSLQHEGKRLLAQLDETREVVRRHTQKSGTHRTDSLPLSSTASSLHDELARLSSSSTATAQLTGGGERPAGQDAPAGSHVTPVRQEAGPAKLSTSGATLLMQPDEFASVMAPANPPSPVNDAATEQERTQVLSDEQLRGVRDSADVPVTPADSAADAECGTADTVAPVIVEGELEEDENAVKRYMERLLRRVASRGQAGEACEPEPSRGTRSASPPATPEAVADATRNTVARDDSLPAAKASVAIPAPPPRTCSEMAADLLAMRELANQSARDAIENCDRRRIVSAAIGEFMVGTACLVFSGMVIAGSSAALTLTGVGGYLGMAFGGVILTRGGYLLYCSRTVRSIDDKHADAES